MCFPNLEDSSLYTSRFDHHDAYIRHTRNGLFLSEIPGDAVLPASLSGEHNGW